ncbi:MAG: zinc-binding dehydrogenase [Frankia sp.]|nr:zinc-binding dehydrogenase [Frankia sp.]
MPTTMRAAVFEADGRRLALRELSVPEPGPLEVLVQVAACGICLSDVHLLDGSIPPVRPVVVPGHEAAGVVVAVGELVPQWQPGDEVVLGGGRPCQACRACARGRSDACENFEIMGFAYDGAWAEYVVVPYGTLIPKPAGLSFPEAAILADAVSTPYAGLIERGGLRPGEAVGLWGIGGLGVHAVQIARLVGAAPIIAVDPNPAARARALAAGADHALDPADPDVVSQVLAVTDGRGLDLAVDLAGANAVLAQGQRCLARGGRLLVIGLSMEPLALAPGLLLGVLRQSVLGHLGYGRRDLEQVVALAGAGRIDVSGSISGLLALDEVHEGVRRLAEKDGDPIRLVIEPGRAG